MDNFLRVTVVAAFLALSANASAIPLSDVGMLDEVYDETDLANAGYGTQNTWVKSALDPSVDYTKYDFSGTWLKVDDGDSATDYWAIDFFADQQDGAGLTTGPDYFLIKIGQGTGATSSNNNTFLFQNNANLQYGFIDLSVLGVNEVGEVGIISHFGATGSSVSVPEPGTIILMTLGLSGLLVARRRKRAA